MIKSENLKLKYIKNFDNEYIEQELQKLYKSVIRWSIVDISDEICINVSYEV